MNQIITINTSCKSYLAFLSNSPVFSFLFKIKGNLFETTIMLPLLLHVERLTVTLTLFCVALMMVIPFSFWPITVDETRVRVKMEGYLNIKAVGTNNIMSLQAIFNMFWSEPHKWLTSSTEIQGVLYLLWTLVAFIDLDDVQGWSTYVVWVGGLRRRRRVIKSDLLRVVSLSECYFLINSYSVIRSVLMLIFLFI